MSTDKTKKSQKRSSQVERIVSRPLPTGRNLILLSREYVDNNELFNGDDKLGFDYEISEQKQFMKIVRWLKDKGY